MKKVKIALLGIGNVGRGVWRIIQSNSNEIEKRSGYQIEISKVLVKDINKKRDIDIPNEKITATIEDIIKDKDVRIVVELMGGTEPAFDYIMMAIKNKKHVVTANKLLIATRGNELKKAAEEEGVMLYYEGSVGGGIPVIHSINESLTANKIEEVIGIINGTTNYILTKMTYENMDFEEALKEAQNMGYAEADPTSDVEGFDALYKLAILSNLAFGTWVDTNAIYKEGITKIKPIDIQYAREFGYVIKLLAIVKNTNNLLELRVHPAMIPSTHPLANVNDAYNAIFIKGNAVGNLMLYGRGAGELPTGSAVVGDVISILRNNIDMEYKTFNNNCIISIDTAVMGDTESEYYIRITVKDMPGVLGEISTIFGTNNVSISSVIQKGNSHDFVPLVFITHKTKEKNINNSINSINNLPSVYKVENIIRVEKFEK